MEEKKTYKQLIKEAIEELKTPGKRHKQIPNILTSLRLLSPLVIIPTALSGNVPLTIALAAGFGLTDCVDGMIARKFNLTSELGRDLDAFTDKIFVGSLLVVPTIANPILLLNIALEGAIAAVNIKEKKKGNTPKTVQVGRVKTWALFTLAGLGLLSLSPGLNLSLTALSTVTAGAQLVTLKKYIDTYNGNEEEQIDNRRPEPPIEIKEQVEKQREEQEKQYQKTKENPNSYNDLESLKELSDYLHQEQDRIKNTSIEDNYQKTKKRRY